MASTNTPHCFLDANAWLSAFIETQDQRKSAIAKTLIQDNVLVASTQVINEATNVCLRKLNFNRIALFG